MVTSLTLGPGEAVGANASVGGHAASSVQAAVLTNRWGRKERKTNTDTRTRLRAAKNPKDISGFYESGLLFVVLDIMITLCRDMGTQ